MLKINSFFKFLYLGKILQNILKFELWLSLYLHYFLQFLLCSNPFLSHHVTHTHHSTHYPITAYPDVKKKNLIK